MIQAGRGKYIHCISNHSIRSRDGKKTLFDLLKEGRCRSLLPQIISRKETNYNISINKKGNLVVSFDTKVLTNLGRNRDLRFTGDSGDYFFHSAFLLISGP